MILELWLKAGQNAKKKGLVALFSEWASWSLGTL
jgi:hypothetical protein